MTRAPVFRTHWRPLAAAVALLIARPLPCQIVELNGGISSLSQSEGGRLTVRGQSYSGSIGAGTISGHVFGGVQLAKRTENSTFTLGTETIPFTLPTDIFDGNHYLTGVGAGVTTRKGTSRLRAFIGETSTQYDSPFFLGAKGGDKTAFISMTADMRPGLVESYNALFSNNVTLINSLAWTPQPAVKLAVSGGIGASQPYGATSLWATWPHLELKAAYYAASSQFRRADVRTPLSSEADRENILLIFRPSANLALTAGRQNYLSPVFGSPTNIRSTVNQVSETLQARGYVLSSSLLESTYSRAQNTSLVLSLGKQVGPRFSAQETVLASRPDGSNSTIALVTNVQEVLTARWTLSQIFNSSNGSNTVGFGGSFLSNFATISAEYQTYYVPARVSAPFEQALIANVRVRPLDRVDFAAATFVSPTGHLLYTVSAEGAVSRQPVPSTSEPDRRIWGKATLRGRVVDTQGHPVMGAAILFDQMRVYSDSDGYFYLREQKPRWHGVKVLSDEFLDGIRYRVVSAPVTIRSIVGESTNDAAVVVEPIPADRSQ